MRKISLLFSAVMLAATGCGHSSGTPHAPSVDTSVPVAAMADSMVARMSPQQSARVFVEWIEDIDRADVTYASRLAKALSSRYGADAAGFNSAVDSLTGTLSPEQQVKIFATVSSPMTLGKAVKADPEAERLIPLIIDFYGADSTSVSAFRTGMK